MRYFVTLIASLICFQAIAQNAEKSPATAAYNERAIKIARKAVNAAISKHPERFGNVKLKIRYAVDRDGVVHNVKVESHPSKQSAEKTIADVLAATKFPSIPIDVQLEVGAGYLEAEAELTLTDPLTASKKESPAAYDYNMRVHKILQDDLTPSFNGPDRLEVDYEFYLDGQGHVTSMKVHAKAGGQRGEQLLTRSIRRIKCPPIPLQVFKELEEKPPLRIYGTMSWEPGAIDTIKRICHQAMGAPFQDATLPVQLAPFANKKSEVLQPTTSCDLRYCSGVFRLHEGYQVIYTFLHVPSKGQRKPTADLTPDAGQKGNNRYVGIELIKDGKIIFSEGRIDSETSQLALKHR